MKYIILFFFFLLSMQVKSQSVYGADIDWSNPTFISGSNLPSIFQRYYLNGDYKSMLELTSIKSRNRFGDAKLIEYFQEMEFGYTFKVKNRVYQGDSSQILFAEATFNATKVRVKFHYIVENGNSKMIISKVAKPGIFPNDQLNDN